MSIRRKFFFIFLFFIINMFLVVGFLVIRDATSLNYLSKEVSILSNLNVTTDRYNRKIQSNGGYAVVEKTMKNYLDQYALEIQDLSLYVPSTKLSKILSYDNYLEDGPEFVNSLLYLDEIQNEYNEKVDEMLRKSTKKFIRDEILSKTNDEYYISLYEKYMFQDDLMHSIRETKSVLKNSRVEINHIIDVSREVLHFLNAYNGSWELKDGQILFKTQDLCNYYDSLIQEVMGNKKEN